MSDASPVGVEGVLALIELAKREHERAVGASALFSVEHWKHNAGQDWPEMPDDDSYLFFENCVHPACRASRDLEVLALALEQKGTTRDE